MDHLWCILLLLIYRDHNYKLSKFIAMHPRLNWMPKTGGKGSPCEKLTCLMLTRFGQGCWHTQTHMLLHTAPAD